MANKLERQVNAMYNMLAAICTSLNITVDDPASDKAQAAAKAHEFWNKSSAGSGASSTKKAAAAVDSETDETEDGDGGGEDDTITGDSGGVDTGDGKATGSNQGAKASGSKKNKAKAHR